MDKKIDEALKETDELINKCLVDFNGIDGALKLKRKLESEKKFLISLKDCDIQTQESSLCCLNLIHLKAIVKQIESLENITSIFKTFKDKEANVLVIDIVYDYGYKWAKILARNPQALHFKLFCEHNTEIINQAEQYLDFAEVNTCNYKVPKVLFNFSNGITQPLYSALEKHVFLSGPIVEIDKKLEEKLRMCEDQDDSSSDEESIEKSPPKEISPAFDENDLEASFEKLVLENRPYGNLNKVNLDVSTLLALVSDLSNGNFNLEFDKEYLNQQADAERKSSVVPILEEFMKDKELFVCQTAFDSFNNIIYTVGGKRERERSEKLIKRLVIVPDNPDPKVMAIKENKKIKRRTKIIFGTGEYLQAITTTSNFHFVRAANNQGQNFTVYLHQPRALTEQKAEKNELREI